MMLVEEGQALVEIHVPLVCAADLLLLRIDRLGRAGVLADPAARAEGIDAMLARRRGGEGGIVQYGREPEVRTEIAVDDRAVLAKLAEAAGQRRRDQGEVPGRRPGHRLIPADAATPQPAWRHARPCRTAE